jgi:hypothetical protein
MEAQLYIPSYPCTYLHTPVHTFIFLWLVSRSLDHHQNDRKWEEWRPLGTFSSGNREFTEYRLSRISMRRQKERLVTSTTSPRYRVEAEQSWQAEMRWKVGQSKQHVSAAHNRPWEAATLTTASHLPALCLPFPLHPHINNQSHFLNNCQLFHSSRKLSEIKLQHK